MSDCCLMSSLIFIVIFYELVMIPGIVLEQQTKLNFSGGEGGYCGSTIFQLDCHGWIFHSAS